MQIIIDDKEIEQMVKEQVDSSVRKRIKEMQGDYTSKNYLKNLIQDFIWDKIYAEIPDIEDYIKSEIDRCIEFQKEVNPKITKSQLINSVVDAFLERNYDK